MKKLILTILFCLILITSILVLKNPHVSLNIASWMFKPTAINKEINTGYYYNLLNVNEQEIYKQLYSAIIRKENSCKIVKDVNEIIDLQTIQVCFQAVLNDNPILFFVGGSYEVSKISIANTEMFEVKFDYIEDNIEEKQQEVEKEVQKIISMCITDGMTDYEKELAIYDYLVSNISYYQHEDIQNIPKHKHTLYSALVNKNAVCDGFSKAFKYILDKINIKSIIVVGLMNQVSHCWNLVNLDNNWYNVDVTAGRQKLSNTEEYQTVHVFFNVSDSEMIEYIRDDMFETPKCKSLKYNYYLMENLYIDSTNGLGINLQKIEDNSQRDVLEVKVNEEEITSEAFITALYNINFNNYKSNKITEINYNKMGSVYMLVRK